jgi:hypothetical protein
MQGAGKIAEKLEQSTAALSLPHNNCQGRCLHLSGSIPSPAHRMDALRCNTFCEMARARCTRPEARAQRCQSHHFGVLSPLWCSACIFSSCYSNTWLNPACLIPFDPVWQAQHGRDIGGRFNQVLLYAFVQSLVYDVKHCIVCHRSLTNSRQHEQHGTQLLSTCRARK